MPPCRQRTPHPKSMTRMFANSEANCRFTRRCFFRHGGRPCPAKGHSRCFFAQPLKRPSQTVPYRNAICTTLYMVISDKANTFLEKKRFPSSACPAERSVSFFAASLPGDCSQCSRWRYAFLLRRENPPFLRQSLAFSERNLYSGRRSEPAKESSN